MCYVVSAHCIGGSFQGSNIINFVVFVISCQTRKFNGTDIYMCVHFNGTTAFILENECLKILIHEN